ncbi:MAG: MBL fold metallo-hydrolase [Candidatus Pseudobacter hemicellulosilyticus]|uniref:MBL fold metallo-hydrolase n=1 Tax=Candidatus Pseudobacter hemicellulosilyticus TaxID=3121375 RepID=A0AAJ5WZP6_9BACT|nr:MAG: MBL fold metallo-hydrolase [Pseudobacter sp.]
MLTVNVFTFSPIQENTYVISNERGDCIIVDPGCYFDHERNELMSFIQGERLRPKYLLNTHGHLDHVFGVQFIYETYGLKPHLHPTEKIVFDYAPVSATKYGLSFPHYTGDLLNLREGDTIRLGEDAFTVLFTPGHSPGHVVFYCKAQAFVIGGDVLFRESIGRTDLPGGDYATLERSIREQLYTLPDETIIYPGHGPATTIGHEKKQNPFVKEA